LIIEILLAAAGFLIALAATMAGIGGGVFMVPLLYFISGDISVAVGTSKFVIIFVSGMGSLSYYRLGLIRSRLWYCILASMLPSSLLGAYIVGISNHIILRIIVGSFIIYYSIRLLWKRRMQIKRPLPRRSCMGGFTAGLVSGLIAGITGTGGGAVNMPILLGFMHLPIREAAALSTSLIFPSALAAGTEHLLQGLVSPVYAASLAAGVIPGALIGPHLSLRISTVKLRLIIGLILLAVGILMVTW
jgi:uncharacterized membrane protein YfcA